MQHNLKTILETIMGKGERRNHFKTAPQNWLPWQADPRDCKRSNEAKRDSRNRRNFKKVQNGLNHDLIIQENLAQEPSEPRHNILEQFTPATHQLLTRPTDASLED